MSFGELKRAGTKSQYPCRLELGKSAAFFPGPPDRRRPDASEDESRRPRSRHGCPTHIRRSPKTTRAAAQARVIAALAAPAAFTRRANVLATRAKVHPAAARNCG